MDNNTSFVVYWKTMGFRNISSVLKKSRVTVCLLVDRFYTRGGASATWECKLRFLPRMQFSVSILKFRFHVESFKFGYLFISRISTSQSSFLCLVRSLNVHLKRYWVSFRFLGESSLNSNGVTRNGSIFGHKLLKFFTKYSYNARMLEVGGNRSASCEE